MTAVRKPTVLVTLAMADPTGAGKMAAGFSAAMIRRGWRVVVACGPGPRYGGDSLPRTLRALGAQVEELDRLVAPTPAAWRELRAIARATRPDLVLGFMQRDRPIAVALARSLGVPSVLHVGNQHIFWGAPPVRFAKRLLYRALVPRWTSLAVCTSESVANELIALGMPRSRTEVLANGIAVPEPVHVTSTERERLRRELGAGPEDRLLVTVGRLDLQKGQDILLTALSQIVARMPGVRLALIGEPTGGSARDRSRRFAEELREQVQRQGLAAHVVFAGWRSDVRAVLSAADFYVHAARWEGPALCLAILEAMAEELPVVITDCSGWPAGFRDGQQGYVAQAGSADALATGLASCLAASDEQRRDMGRAARRLVVERYDAARLEEQFVDMVERLLS